MNRVHTIIATTALLASLSACTVPRQVSNYIDREVTTVSDPSSQIDPPTVNATPEPTPCPDGSHPAQAGSNGELACQSDTVPAPPCPAGTHPVQVGSDFGMACESDTPPTTTTQPSVCPVGEHPRQEGSDGGFVCERD